MNIRSVWHRGYNRIYTAVSQKLYEKEFVSSEGQSLRYLFFPCPGSDLLAVGFQACNDAGPRYNYVRTLQACGVNRLFIKDDFGPGHLGDYYLGCSGTYSVEQAVRELIDRTAASFAVPCRLVFCGSSKGGYAALNFGLQYPASAMILAAPQYYLADYLDSPKFHATLEEILGGAATPGCQTGFESAAETAHCGRSLCSVTKRVAALFRLGTHLSGTCAGSAG